jgi:hypothetical protein
MILTLLPRPPLHHPIHTAFRAMYQGKATKRTNWIKADAPAPVDFMSAPHTATSRGPRVVRHGGGGAQCAGKNDRMGEGLGKGLGQVDG